MSKSVSKVIDVEMGDDGVYVAKGSKKAIVKREVKKERKKLNRDEADDFLQGMDAGLDFVEEIGLRVDRFLRLRG